MEQIGFSYGLDMEREKSWSTVTPNFAWTAGRSEWLFTEMGRTEGNRLPRGCICTQFVKCEMPPLSPEVCSNSCPWTLFSFCLQSSLASASFTLSQQLFASGGQSIGASDSALVLLVNIQGWFPLGWTGWISLQSKGLSRVFSNTTVQNHQFFSTQLSLWSNSHIHTWLLGKS